MTLGNMRELGVRSLAVKCSVCVLSDPRHVTIHPALEKFSARGADAAVRVEEAVLHLDEDLRLAKRRYIKIGEDSAQMLLGNRRTDRTN